MRSMWKGHIRFSLVVIPVRVYNALETAEKIHLNMLHKEDYGPIAYDKRCKKCGKILPADEIIKGYQYAPDQYAILEADDIAKVKVKTTKMIDIVGFVDKSEVSPILYEAPYYAGPDGDVSLKLFALLRQALEDSGKIGLGKVVLRDREDFVAIAPQDDGIVVYKLHYPTEIRKMDEVPQIHAHQNVDANELKLARTLIDQLSTSVAEIEMKDSYNEALRQVIEAKIEGKEVAGYVEEEQPTLDIMTALKQSIQQAERKPMVKARGEKAKALEQPAEEEEAAPKRIKKRKAS